MKFHWALHIAGVALSSFCSCNKQADLPDTLVYGHAGTTLYPERWVYPPNTKESVIYALDVLDAEGVEVDVQMTRDSVLVLYHDAYLDDHTTISGCISGHDYAVLKELEVYKTRCQLARLDEVMAICMTRHKFLFLDLKPYHYCESVNVDDETFDRALNRILDDYSAPERSMVLINTRNPDLLNELSDTNTIRCFETEDISLALEKYTAGHADEACISLTALKTENVKQLKNAGLKFTIFGMKTHAEIEAALLFEPMRVITDNIAYTQKRTP